MQEIRWSVKYALLKERVCSDLESLLTRVPFLGLPEDSSNLALCASPAFFLVRVALESKRLLFSCKNTKVSTVSKSSLHASLQTKGHLWTRLKQKGRQSKALNLRLSRREFLTSFSSKSLSFALFFPSLVLCDQTHSQFIPSNIFSRPE